MNKTEQLLKFIGRSKTGRTFTDIQRFVVGLADHDYDEKDDRGQRIWRGFWCDHLCDTIKPKAVLGASGFVRMDIIKHPGILSRFCRKEGKRYFLK